MAGRNTITRSKQAILRGLAPGLVILTVGLMLSACSSDAPGPDERQVVGTRQSIDEVPGARQLPKTQQRIKAAPQVSGFTEQAYGLLAKNKLEDALVAFDAALGQDSHDVHALIGKALALQHMGDLAQAQRFYKRVLQESPDDSVKMMAWNDFKSHSVRDVARTNLAYIESTDVVADDPVLDNQLRVVNAEDRPLAQTGSLRGGSDVSSRLSGSGSGALLTTKAPVVAGFNEADSNVVKRFNVLRALRDEGLITPEEYEERRKANLGALLPLTNAVPAVDYSKPMSPAPQISGRLRAIRAALETRAISLKQHTAERQRILETVLPRAPRYSTKPAAPPATLDKATERLNRLDKIRDAGLITTAEYQRESGELKTNMQPRRRERALADAGMLPGQTAHGLHLASYRSKEAAEKGWQQIQKAFRSVVGRLKPLVERTDLGPDKGIFYRLKVGPVETEEEARHLCSKLKRLRQYCDPTDYITG